MPLIRRSLRRVPRAVAAKAGRSFAAAAGAFFLVHPAPVHAATTARMSTRQWTMPLATGTPLDPRSPALVNTLVTTVRNGIASGRSPWIATGRCAYREYRVPASQRARRVALSDADMAWRAPLQAAFERVPIPVHAIPTRCSDSVLVIKQPSTNRMWELWKARRAADGWHAEWGGATRHLSTNPGWFGPDDWPGATYNWGASASSMTLTGGTVRLSEWRNARIDHAVALSLPQVAAGVWAWPAQRTDGVLTAPSAIPYGARFRLDPALNIAALDVPAATKTLARAVQRYGFIVREQTNWAVGVSSEATPENDPTAYQRVFGGTAGEVMQAFPWNRLKLVRMDLRSNAGPPAR